MSWQEWQGKILENVMGNIIAATVIVGAIAVWAVIEKLPGPVVVALVFAILAFILSVRNALLLNKQLKDSKKHLSSIPMFYGDLCWEIMPEFFKDYLRVENPSSGTLDSWIKGPFCPKCGRPLRLEPPQDSPQVNPHGGELFILENPCEGCKQIFREPFIVGDQRVEAEKFRDRVREVYKEARRLTRMKKSLPSGSCTN
jgi:hypothetical protein